MIEGDCQSLSGKPVCHILRKVQQHRLNEAMNFVQRSNQAQGIACNEKICSKFIGNPSLRYIQVEKKKVTHHFNVITTLSFFYLQKHEAGEDPATSASSVYQNAR